eukprot:s6460_g2.t2
MQRLHGEWLVILRCDATDVSYFESTFMSLLAQRFGENWQPNRRRWLRVTWRSGERVRLHLCKTVRAPLWCHCDAVKCQALHGTHRWQHVLAWLRLEKSPTSSLLSRTCWILCWERLVQTEVLEVKFWCLQVILQALSSISPVARVELRGKVLSWLREVAGKKQEVVVKNKVALVYAGLIKFDYPAQWPSAWQERSP